MNDIPEMKRRILNSIRLLCFIALPLFTFLVFASKPLLVLLFERGKFTHADAAVIGVVVALLAPYVLLSRLNGIIQIPFYATMDVRTPLLGSAVSFAVSAVFALLLIRSMGVYGLPISVCLGSLMSLLVMSRLFQKKFGVLGWKTMLSYLLRLLATLALTAVLVFLLGLSSNGPSVAENLGDKLLAFLPVTVGVILFLAASIVFRLIDLRELRGFLVKAKV